MKEEPPTTWGLFVLFFYFFIFLFFYFFIFLFFYFFIFLFFYFLFFYIMYSLFIVQETVWSASHGMNQTVNNPTTCITP